MSAFEVKMVRREIYGRWFAGEITYNEMMDEIAAVPAPVKP